MPIVINSRFKPLTYDEITRPLIEQTQAQEALENAYMEAQDQAAQIMSQANEQTDPIAYARLKNYSEALQQQADSLMRQGLSSNSRQSLINMRRRYAQDIIPVQTAITRRNELMEERRKLRLTHPDMLQERDVIGLDELLQNPTADLGTTVYGSDISKRAAAITAAIGKGRQQIALGRNLDAYTQQVLSQSGLTAEEIQAALAGDDSQLDKALSALYSSTGVDNWDNQAAKDAVRNYITEGAMQGVGEVNISAHQDHAAIRRDQLSDRVEEHNWWLKQHGLKIEDGHIVADRGSYMYDHRGGQRAATTSGQIIDIESVGPKTSRYGTIGKTSDGLYYRQIGSKWEYINDQEDAAKLFVEGNPTNDNTVTPTQRSQRAQFDSSYGGMISFNKKLEPIDNSVDDNDADIKVALEESDTDYYTAQNVPNKELWKEAIKDTGYTLDDYYFIYNRKGRNHWNAVLKKVAAIQYPELVKKYEKSTIPTIQPQVVENPTDTTSKVTPRRNVSNVGL